MTDTTDDKSPDPGSQADELTEMWDASALEAAAAGFEPPVEAPQPTETSSGRPRGERSKPTAQEGSDTPKPPVKTEEGSPSDQSAPAGYKANPFD